jgi:hypothetical protein
MNAGAWKRELAAYRKKFINSKGWSEKQVASWIRDAWAYFDNGELAIPLETRSDALPVFQFRTPAGWKLPLLLRLHVLEQFRLQGRLQGDSSVKSLTPREEVFALIREQGSTITGQSGQSELKRELAERRREIFHGFLIAKSSTGRAIPFGMPLVRHTNLDVCNCSQRAEEEALLAGVAG